MEAAVVLAEVEAREAEAVAVAVAARLRTTRTLPIVSTVYAVRVSRQKGIRLVALAVLVDPVEKGARERQVQQAELAVVHLSF